MSDVTDGTVQLQRGLSQRKRPSRAEKLLAALEGAPVAEPRPRRKMQQTDYHEQCRREAAERKREEKAARKRAAKARRIAEQRAREGKKRTTSNDHYRGRIPKARRYRVFSRDYYRCVQCGERENLTLDHVIPVAHGGTNDECNLQTMCEPCNNRKGSKRDRG